MHEMKDLSEFDSSAIYGLKMGAFALMCFSVGIVTYVIYDVMVLFEIPLNAFDQLKKDYRKYCKDKSKIQGTDKSK